MVLVEVAQGYLLWPIMYNIFVSEVPVSACMGSATNLCWLALCVGTLMPTSRDYLYFWSWAKRCSKNIRALVLSFIAGFISTDMLTISWQRPSEYNFLYHRLLRMRGSLPLKVRQESYMTCNFIYFSIWFGLERVFGGLWLRMEVIGIQLDWVKILNKIQV